MKKLLIIFVLAILFSSCGDNPTEPVQDVWHGFPPDSVVIVNDTTITD